jgi:hypothetical protein
MTYGMIFWGNSTHSLNIFKTQRRVFGIITGRRSRASCRKLLKELKIFPLESQYIISSLLMRLIRKATVQQIQDNTVHILDTAMFYIYLTQTWLFIKKKFITQVFKSLIIFHNILKILWQS